ncbi:hypothetical protein BGX30_009972 [Mortierella sp. GBA39]|nr:hypothetical protein BGX30_009972 [Mortierella sp. GBA39]
MANYESEPLEEDDPANMARTLSHVPMSAVIEKEDFEFTAKLGSIEFGEDFTAYFNHYQALRYDADNLADSMNVEGQCVISD